MKSSQVPAMLMLEQDLLALRISGRGLMLRANLHSSNAVSAQLQISLSLPKLMVPLVLFSGTKLLEFPAQLLFLRKILVYSSQLV